MMNKNISTKIYEQIILGKYINKQNYNEKEKRYKQNELYNELDTCFIEYKDLYEKLGYELIRGASYFYLMSKTTEDTKNLKEHQLKEYIVFITLIRYIYKYKIGIQLVLNSDYGIDEPFVEKIFKDNDFYQLLFMADIKNEKAFIEALFKRNILEKNENSKYFLSDVGKHYIEVLQNEIKDTIEEDMNE